jgi:hypothetical protein
LIRGVVLIAADCPDSTPQTGASHRLKRSASRALEHINEHIAPSEKDDFDEFEFGLDMLLDGLDKLRMRSH